MSESFVTLFSILGELIQVCGILMISLLFVMMYRVLRLPYMLLWAKAWVVLFVALFSLHIAFTVPQLSLVQFFYFLGEYGFAYYLWKGISQFSKLVEFKPRTEHIFFVCISLWSLFLATRTGHFGFRFQFHAALFILFLLPSIYAALIMCSSLEERWATYGVVVSISLLVLNFLCGLFSVFDTAKVGPIAAVAYTSYQSIFDLSFEALLAFSLIAVAVVSVRAQLQLVNSQLRDQRDVMRDLAHQDALTDCYNRRIMAKLFTESRDRSGSIAVIDIDKLKPINDRYGHKVGDLAIKTVADAIKLHIRNHDYLIRSGGDEFVLIAFDLSVNDLVLRLQAINKTLSLGNSELPVTVGVSWGVEAFSADVDLEQSFTRADEAMYQYKIITSSSHIHPAV